MVMELVYAPVFLVGNNIGTANNEKIIEFKVFKLKTNLKRASVSSLQYVVL